jgi:hypothetical protein
LPIVSQIVEASEQHPCLAMSMKLEMPLVRELLDRDEIQIADAPADSPAMATGETTVEFLDACCRLLDLLDTPRDIPFLAALIQREIIYRILCGPEGVRLRAIATSGDQSHRTAKAIAWIRTNYAKPLRVEDLADISGMGVSTGKKEARGNAEVSFVPRWSDLATHCRQWVSETGIPGQGADWRGREVRFRVCRTRPLRISIEAPLI